MVKILLWYMCLLFLLWQSLVNVIILYIIDQRKLLFLKKICTCDNSVLWSFYVMCTHEYGKMLSGH